MVLLLASVLEARNIALTDFLISLRYSKQMIYFPSLADGQLSWIRAWDRSAFHRSYNQYNIRLLRQVHQPIKALLQITT